ncbi:MAG: hypothetical protein K8J31_14840, partial [Anaerolineae bacterium]|nr:hypothetical protein [Anaerolineae bacterium]
EYISSHDHEYKIANTITNTACDLQNVAFADVSYSLDAYPSPDEAAAALADPALAELTTASGFTSTVGDSGLTVYTRTGSVCDTDVITGRAYWQRGHFVATAQITIPASVEVPMDQILTSFVGQQIYEQILSSVLRPEIRES